MMNITKGIKEMNKNMKSMTIDNDDPLKMAPKIDKLSGVVDISEEALCGLAFSNMIDWFDNHEPGIVKVQIKGQYQIAAKIHYPGEDGLVHLKSPFVLLQLTHPKLTKRQVRFEYNPSHMTEAGEVYLAEKFQGLLGVDSFYEFLYHARFTRVDICQDILGRSLEDYLFRAKWKQVSQSFFGPDGSLQTINLGKSAGSQIVVYDKAAQLHGNDAMHSTIRVEVRRRMNMTIGELVNLPNPFSPVEVYSVMCSDPPFGLAHWRGFQDACRLRGVNNAIKCQPVKNRSALKKALSTQQVSWWSIAADDWDFLWTEALENAGLLNIPDAALPLTMKYTVGLAA